ncbi:MAG: hypothetical protein VKN15_03305 [Cyanobacteriota bacterium]|nr:hypothetical protein [Cyanobacteriota bacterium]
MTIDCATALIRGRRNLYGVVKPQAGDRLKLASGMSVFFPASTDVTIRLGQLHIFSLTSPLRGAWQSVAASLFGEAYLFVDCLALTPEKSQRYSLLQEACQDYIQCWTSLTDDERQMFLHGTTAAVSGVGAVVSGVAFVADLAAGGLPVFQGLTCVVTGAICGYSLGEMSKAAQRGARRARELQGHMQWMTQLLLATDANPNTVIVGPLVTSYCTVVAQGFDGLQRMGERTLRTLSMSTGSIPGAALSA